MGSAASVVVVPHRRRLRALLLVCGASIVAAAAGLVVKVPSACAQTPPPAASGAGRTKAKLAAPRLLTEVAVDYPRDGTGDAVVVVELLIGPDGAVQSVTVVRGDEPFATAAATNAKAWKFDPATRDGVPIKSRIPFTVTFTAPVVEPAPPPDAPPTEPVPSVSPTPAASATVPAPTSPPPPTKGRVDQDVIVLGDRQAPSVTRFSRAEVRELPGAFGDPFRALESMPGVTPIVSGVPFFYVRGAPPGNVGYFLDGIRVPYLFHVGLGPSVIHPGMVDHVDLYSGGYPAGYGRYAGGIVSGEVTPARADTHGEANLRVFDAGVLVETGFGDGKGTILLGGRYSYTAAAISLLVHDVQLDYRDFQTRVTYDVTPRDRLTLFAFGAYDLLGQRPPATPDTLNILFGSEFYRADLRYDHAFVDGTTLRYAVTLGFDQTKVADQRNARDKMLATRLEVRHPLNGHVLIRGGADVTQDTYDTTLPQYTDPDNPDTVKANALFPARTDYAGGVWIDAVLTPTARVEVTPGVRADFFKSGDASATSVDPRLSARFTISDAVKIVHAYGITHQAPSFIAPVPGLVVTGLAGGLQSAIQTSAGVELKLPADIFVTSSVFYNVFSGMTDALGTSVNAGNDLLSGRRSDGRAVGFEFFAKRRLTKDIGGYFTYTLSRSERTVDGITTPSAFDRTHVVSAALSYDLGARWRAGTKFTFYTGAPQVSSSHGLLPPPPTQSPDRDPGFYRIDLRIEKRWVYGDTRWLAFVFELLNATLHKEVVAGSEIGPVTVPSIGLEGAL
ncbi:MAG: TonB family protein [Polyangiales bacterium]